MTLHPTFTTWLRWSTIVAVTAGTAVQMRAQDAGLARNLQPLIDQHVIAGAVILVANKDKVLDLETIGFSDLEKKKPMTRNSMGWIASMTKSMTATAIMMLADEGKLSIDDPVAKHLPQFKTLLVLPEGAGGPAHPAQQTLLIRHLLTHTGGFAEKPSLPHQSLREDADVLAARPLEAEPGTRYQYSNSGINTLGRIIEVISGASYFDFVRSRLLDPLGMKDSTFWPNEAQASRLAKSYKQNAAKTGMEGLAFNRELIANPDRRDGVPAAIHSQFNSMSRTYAARFAEPAGGLFSTAEDIAKFCQMILNQGTYRGKKYLSAASIRQMGSLQTGKVPMNPRGGFGHEGYGFGWTVHRPDEGPAGDGFGHLGARKTMMWVDPTRQLVLVMLVQCAELAPKDQRSLYAAFIPAAIERYGVK